MTFPVNGTIPGPNDLLSQSQGAIQTNFNNILGWAGIDHIAYGATNAGTHEQITIITPQGAPAPASTTGIVTTQTVTNSELFYTNSSKNMQISNSLLTASGGAGMCPGGLQIRVGSGTASTGGVDNPIAPAFPNACLGVVASGDGFGFVISVSSASLTPSKFRAFSSLSSTTIRFIAVGY